MPFLFIFQLQLPGSHASPHNSKLTFLHVLTELAICFRLEELYLLSKSLPNFPVLTEDFSEVVFSGRVVGLETSGTRAIGHVCGRLS